MATYIPNAVDPTEPTESKNVGTAALEFRTLKASVNARVDALQAEVAAEVADRIASDLKALQVPETSIGTIPAAAARAGQFLAFGPTGDPVASSGTGADAGLRADLASTASGKGAELVGYLPSGTGAVATNLKQIADETVSVFRFMVPAQIADVQSGSPVLDHTVAVQTCLAACGTVNFEDGVYSLTGTLDFQNKVVRGTRKSPGLTYSSTRKGVLLRFNLPDTATPAINVGGFFGIENITAVRTGAAMRGVVVNVASQVQRLSFIKQCYFSDCSYPIYGGNPANFVYSTTFEEIEFGNFSQLGFYLNCGGATGNIYKNLYFSNWLDFDAGTKNTAQAFMWLQGSHTEGLFGQINCEHSVITNSAVLLNGVETATIDSWHLEGVEFNGGTQALRVISGGQGAKINITSMAAVFCKMLGNEVRAFNVDTTSGGTLNLDVSGFKTRNNDANGFTNHRLAIRGGTVTTNTPTIKIDGLESDLFSGNSFLPIEATTFKPILEQLNSQMFYERIGSAYYMPSLSAAPTAGVYPANAIIMNSAVAATGDRGWHVWAKGDFSKPQQGTVSYSAFSGSMTADATAYAYFAVGDYIDVSGVVYKITARYSGTTFNVTPNTPGTPGTSVPCLVAAPQYRAIS